MFLSRLGRLLVWGSLWAPVAAAAQSTPPQIFVASENHVFQLDGLGHQDVFLTTSPDHWPLALVFDRAGILYASLTGTGEIRTFGRNGEDFGVFATNGGADPFADLAFDAAGNLYASRFSNNEIWRFAPDGTGVVFAVAADGPVGLTVGDDGHLFVAVINANVGGQGGAIFEYAQTGALLNVFGAAGAGDVVFHNGMLWVTSGSTNDIRRYAISGDLIDIFAISGPGQLTFDSAGFVYVADSPALVIRRFSPSGDNLGALFPPLYFPFGIAIRPADVEVVVDIKPGSCRNPLNVSSKGVLPVAIAGTAGLDVTHIDASSLRLAGVAPIKVSIADGVTPPQGGGCGVGTPDGRRDLILHFRTADIVASLTDPIVDGTQRRLRLAGTLKAQFGGTTVEGSDVVELIAK